MKAKLTDFAIQKLKAKERPYEVMDSEVKGFGIRVMGKPKAEVKSFVLVKRFPGSKNPVRRTLGSYRAPGAHDGDLSLAEAREKAGEWNRLLKKGLDPAIEDERQRQAELEAERKREVNTFGAALAVYLQRKAKLKSVDVIGHELRRECQAWMEWPLEDITPRDVRDLIGAIAQRGETQAHAVFGMLRGFLNWCVDSGDFGIETSPCQKIRPTVLIGPRNIRDRVLKDCELGALWRASGTMGYPFGKLFQLLALTALRRNEAADARWSEIDMDAKLWVIPVARMKGGAKHAVPLTPEILTFLESLPRFNSGDFLFSTTGGQKPVSGFSKAKVRLDALMRMDLEAHGKPFEDFVLHDIRRTCRTRFSALPVEDIVRELLVAHARPGLHKVYDLHAYEQEKAHALKLWHGKLKDIVGGKLVRQSS